MQNTWWIGRECKRSNALSGPVLIGRGLDQKHWRSHECALYSFECADKAFGGDYGKGTPVPIPNTAVKLPSADDTWTETSRENKSLPN